MAVTLCKNNNLHELVSLIINYFRDTKIYKFESKIEELDIIPT